MRYVVPNDDEVLNRIGMDNFHIRVVCCIFSLQCFDIVGYVTGRASGL